MSVGAIIATWILVTTSAHAEVIGIDPKACQRPEIALKGTPFQIEIFCEDALGAYLGVVYRGLMKKPSDGGWSIESRYWQIKNWSNDVRSIYRFDDGKHLLISTSDVFGKSGIFYLDLGAKQWRSIYSPDDKKQHELVIVSFDEKSQRLKFKDAVENSAKEIEVKIKN